MTFVPPFLSCISPPFGGLFWSSRQVTHALLTRAPLYSGYCYPFLVRLACVRHAASVRSEPGSNSPKISKPAQCVRYLVFKDQTAYFLGTLTVAKSSLFVNIREVNLKTKAHDIELRCPCQEFIFTNLLFPTLIICSNPEGSSLLISEILTPSISTAPSLISLMASELLLVTPATVRTCGSHLFPSVTLKTGIFAGILSLPENTLSNSSRTFTAVSLS